MPGYYPFQNAKKEIEELINRVEPIDVLHISSVRTREFYLLGIMFPIDLLGYTVEMLRNKNKNILWVIQAHELIYEEKKQYRIYANTWFWKLMANQDQLILKAFPFRYLEKHHEDILQLINGIQLKSIHLKEIFGPIGELPELLDRIQEITRANIICRFE